MNTSLDRMLKKLIRSGQLEITWPEGKTTTYGPGPERVAFRFADDAAANAVANDPTLKVGEMYMDGRLIMEEGSVYDLLSLVLRNGDVLAATPGAIFNHFRRAVTNSRWMPAGLTRARRNIAHHYDIDERLYRLFLDPDMNYSCAYFEHDGQGLEDAQRAKQRHIAGKLLSRPGSSVLDIGCGWGGMGLYLTEAAGLETTGITLSQEQARVARARAEARGVGDRFKVEICDYREKTGRFDHIVSIGMLEHVGMPQLPTYFRKVADLLDKRGTALIHSMAQTRGYSYSQPFGQKYIFPGGYVPPLSAMVRAAEKAGLLIKDVEILPLHYATTTRMWRERFLANREKVLELFDERFIRMWEFYLAGAEVGFRHQRIHVVHLLLAKHQDRIPIRRGWLEPEKERLLAAEATRAPI